jgi:hypothetical protein
MGPNCVEIVGLGEALWDLFPDGKQLGGAAFTSPSTATSSATRPRWSAASAPT